MYQQQSPGAASAHHRSLTLGDLFAAGGGLLTFLASFLPFVSIDKDLRAPFERSNLDKSWNAWRFETFMAPLTWFIALAALLIVLLVAFRYLTGATPNVATFTLPQIETTMALFVAVAMFGYATSTKSLYFGTEWADSLDDAFATGIDFGIGGYFMLTGGIIALVGTVLNLFRIGPVVFRGQAPAAAAPYGYPTPNQPGPHAVDSDTTNAAQLGLRIDNDRPPPTTPGSTSPPS